MVPDNFKLAINYAWDGIMGAGNWAGYIMAATYYAAEEFGFGADICEFFGYGNWVIEQSIGQGNLLKALGVLLQSPNHRFAGEHEVGIASGQQVVWPLELLGIRPVS